MRSRSQSRSWGLSAYLSTIEETSTIRVPGTSFGGPADRVCIWPPTKRAEEQPDFEDELTLAADEGSRSADDGHNHRDRLRFAVGRARPG